MTAIQLKIPLQKGRYTVVEAPSRYWKIKSKEGFQDADSLTTDHLSSPKKTSSPQRMLKTNVKKTIVLLSLSRRQLND